jgi:hypothetical protein
MCFAAVKWDAASLSPTAPYPFLQPFWVLVALASLCYMLHTFTCKHCTGAERCIGGRGQS